MRIRATDERGEGDGRRVELHEGETIGVAEWFPGKVTRVASSCDAASQLTIAERASARTVGELCGGRNRHAKPIVVRPSAVQRRPEIVP
jgi:hypothetical protein